MEKCTSSFSRGPSPHPNPNLRLVILALIAVSILALVVFGMFPVDQAVPILVPLVNRL